jgi:hypothetical protein
MNVRIINLNCAEKEYDFNMAVITDKDWAGFVNDVVFDRVSSANGLKINGAKIVLRDNHAKIKLFYQDSSYHEVQFLCDAFGRMSQRYSDNASKSFQSMMKKYYGIDYARALDKKLAKLATPTNIVN